VLLLELPRLKTLWKKTCTQNYFCSNPQCYYYQVADERVHALIGYGSHGKYEHIPDLFCQACESKFTIRKYTLLYRFKTHSKIIFMAMSLLALGIDISALQEALGNPGKHLAHMAYSVDHESKTGLKAGTVPIFSSDGLKHYFYALTVHFGEWIVPDGETKAVWRSYPLSYMRGSSSSNDAFA